MKFNAIYAGLALTFFMTGCNSMKVTADRDPKFDFSPVTTYQWIDAPEEILNDAGNYLDKEILKLLDTALTQRGLQGVQKSADADIQMAYYVKRDEEMAYTDSANPAEREFSGGLVYTRENKSWNYAEREPNVNLYILETGTLTLLVYDTETFHQVWRGSLKTKIDRSRSKEEQEARIRAAVKKLISRLPATAD